MFNPIVVKDKIIIYNFLVVEIKICSCEISGCKREIVSARREFFPSRDRNCFGVFSSLSGQSRLPIPPARIKA